MFTNTWAVWGNCVKMKIFIILSFIFHALSSVRSQEELQQLRGSLKKNNVVVNVDPDMNRNVSELISSKGYPVENYDVQTEDGYILTIQRIPGGRKRWIYQKNQKEVVFLQHGLLSSSADWVMNFPNESLGFLLADAGYDVWLGNVRGNTYARRNVKYSPKSKEFWKFSFDEMATYDLPAMIDFVLAKSGQKKLYYIGHSQGTLIAFALLSEKVEYNNKIKLFMGLGPVATVGYINSPIRFLVPFASDLEFLFSLLGTGEFLPNGAVLKFFSKVLCDTQLKFICENIIFLLCGTDVSQMNKTRLHVYTAHSPAGTSTQNIVHFAQMVKSKTFQKFDYGKKYNLIYYNQTTPPQYRVENITAPVALFWSRNDLLADPADVGLLEMKLKNLVESYLVKFPLLNHLDFIYGVNVVGILYDELFRLMNKF